MASYADPNKEYVPSDANARTPSVCWAAARDSSRMRCLVDRLLPGSLLIVPQPVEDRRLLLEWQRTEPTFMLADGEEVPHSFAYRRL